LIIPFRISAVQPTKRPLSLVHLITISLLAFGIAAAQSELPQARIVNLSVDPEQVLDLQLRPGYASSVRVLFALGQNNNPSQCSCGSGLVVSQ
jgi:hypothetical protein